MYLVAIVDIILLPYCDLEYNVAYTHACGIPLLSLSTSKFLKTLHEILTELKATNIMSTGGINIARD